MTQASGDARPPPHPRTDRRCDCCGAASPGLTVLTYAMQLGVLCVSCCPGCTSAATSPQVTIATATGLVAHVGGRPPTAGPEISAPAVSGPAGDAAATPAAPSPATTLWRYLLGR